MDLSLQSIKTDNWSADNLKKKPRHLNNLYNVRLSPGDTGQQKPFFTAVTAVNWP